MPINIKTVSNVQPNQVATFQFQATIQSFLVGISYWNFGFQDDHHLKQLSLALTNLGQSGKTVTCTVDAHLEDSEGNVIRPTLSSVNLVCIAVTGSAADTNVGMTGANGIVTESTSSQLAIASANPRVAQAFLSGWSMRYIDSSDDHHVRQVQFGAGVVPPNGNLTQISATARMNDHSGHVSNGTINANLISLASSATDFVSKVVTGQSKSAVPVQFDKKVSDAAVFLQSYNAIYTGSDDHHVRTIGGGCSGWSSPQGQILTLNDARAWMTDGNVYEDDTPTGSHVTFIAIGIPA